MRVSVSPKRMAVLGGLLVALALPSSSLAQSADGPESAPPDQATSDPVSDAATDAHPAISVPSYVVNTVYLRDLERVRLAWFVVENGINNMARAQRLGTLRPTVMQGAARQYPITLNAMDDRLGSLAPPDGLSEVHQLHLAANAEIHAATDAAEQWFAGDAGALPVAQAHLARFDQFIDRALLDLS